MVFDYKKKKEWALIACKKQRTISNPKIVQFFNISFCEIMKLKVMFCATEKFQINLFTWFLSKQQMNCTVINKLTTLSKVRDAFRITNLLICIAFMILCAFPMYRLARERLTLYMLISKVWFFIGRGWFDQSWSWSLGLNRRVFLKCQFWLINKKLSIGFFKRSKFKKIGIIR